MSVEATQQRVWLKLRFAFYLKGLAHTSVEHFIKNYMLRHRVTGLYPANTVQFSMLHRFDRSCRGKCVVSKSNEQVEQESYSTDVSLLRGLCGCLDTIACATQMRQIRREEQTVETFAIFQQLVRWDITDAPGHEYLEV